MQLKTSFFHKALCKKSFTRFAPVWIAYTVIWFFMLPMQMLTYHYPDYPMSSHVLGSGFYIPTYYIVHIVTKDSLQRM